MAIGLVSVLLFGAGPPSIPGWVPTANLDVIADVSPRGQIQTCVGQWERFFFGLRVEATSVLGLRRFNVGSRPATLYYALAAGSVEPEGAPERLTAGAGRYPIPVVILTRLGVDLAEQGRGLGRALVRDALLQVAAVGTRIGVRALLIHAESPEAARFYLQFDPAFERTPGDPLHLVLLMKNIRAAIRQAAG